MHKTDRKKELIRLVRKYLHGKASDKEKRFVEQYYAYFDKEISESSRLSTQERKQLGDKLLHNIDMGIVQEENVPVISLVNRPFFRIAAAAVIFITTLSIAYFWYGYSSQKEPQMAKNIKLYSNDVQPGGDRAVLTLGDGSTILLDSAQNGALAQQGGAKIIKVNQGELTYNTENTQSKKVLYNTVSTPRAGQYRLVLPDGSKVWLNASSSLQFPTAFTEKERNVVLTGEAYFEVAENKDMPFKVKVNEIEVKVLGTHFNVMAYHDETAISTTLLEGAVTISNGHSNVLLQPGQQANLEKDINAIKVIEANTEEAIAWKNGVFSFNNTDIYQIMRQVSRWYDVDIVYNDSMDVVLNGHINRNVDLSKVLKMLELAGEIHFKISGRKVFVMN